MKFDSLTGWQGVVTISAEGDDERAVLNVAVAVLELIYPKAGDRQRPTPALLLLEALKIIGARKELERNEPSDYPPSADTHRNTAQEESVRQHADLEQDIECERNSTGDGFDPIGGVRTSGKWVPFCPKCHLPLAFPLDQHGSLICGDHECGWISNALSQHVFREGQMLT